MNGEGSPAVGGARIADRDPPGSNALSPRGFWFGIGALWLVGSLLLLGLRAHAIVRHDFLDVDDQLRLVEVRDWLAGQSFYDVTQYRMNAPYGASMHWSRLVDLPLAFVVLLLRPLLGPAVAETVAAVAIPLVTLGAIMAAAGATARRLAGPGAGLLAAGLCLLCIQAMSQVVPLRVDHHGWEIALQFLGLFATLDRDPRRGACVAGVALAVALQISLEPLPFAAAIGLVLGVGWVAVPEEGPRDRLSCFIVTLALAQLALFALLHAPSAWGAGYCDAISPPHLLLLGLAAGGILVATRLRLPHRTMRLAALGLVALCAVAAYRAYPPHCGIDAFASLEPIVRHYWYDRVLEGLPVWKLPPVLASSTIGFPLVGTLCAAYAARHHIAEARRAWSVYAVLLGAATLISMLVQRASGFGGVAATPAAAWMICHVVPKVRKSDTMLVRVPGTVLACFLLSPIAVATMGAMVFPADPGIAKTTPRSVRACSAEEHIAALSALPPSRVLAPLDLGPPILLETGHSPLASGHHRNHAAMAQVITAFLGSPDTAHAIVEARGIGFVLLCPDTSETLLYLKNAPHGFAADLVRGAPPAWLTPMPIENDPILIWKVTQ